MTDHTSSVRGIAPLYLAGLTTAVGAHGVASVLGSESDDIGMSLLGLGFVLALYDLAEVVLKPIFGAMSDRIGPKPVIVGGLLAFAGALAVGILALASTLLQPIVGKLRDRGLISTRTGSAVGLAVAALGLALLAFAHLADSTPEQHLGRTMGNAELGRELGDAGGPLLVGAAATAWALPAALGILAGVTLASAAVGWGALRPARAEEGSA